MGRRGTKPTPTAILKLRGSWRAETRDGEPQPEITLPDPPAWLPDKAREHWQDLGQQLVGVGVMSNVHATALATLCQSLADYIETIPMGVGDARFKAFDRLMKALCQFGMTPSSITAVRANTQTDKKTTFPRLKIAR